MSAETEFRADMLAYAPLTALVGTRIAFNAIPQGLELPYIVYTTAHTPELGLSGAVLADQAVHTVSCWAKTGAEAEAVADAVAAAVALAGDAVVSRSTGYDEELALDATVLAVEHWTV